VSMPLRPSVLAPFAIRSFRFQWPADLLTSWAFEMENLILGWYILVETGSVLLLTVFAALQYLGTLIAPLFGVVGDRIGHRNLLCGMRAVYTTLAAILTALIVSGHLDPKVVFIIAAANGLVRPSDLAVRSALVASTVPPQQLTGAMGISRTTSDSARVFGAIAGAGLFASLGLAPAYAVVTTLYSVGFALTLCVPRLEWPRQTDGATHASPWRDLHEGITYVWSTPHLLAAMWLAFMVNLTAYPLTHGLLPYVAREIYHVDQKGLGYLVASFAFGAVLGSIVLSFAHARFRLARMMIACAAIWYAMLLAFVHMQTPAAGAAVLTLAGLAQSLSLVPLAVILLRTSGEKLRGRVMGVRMLAIYGLPVGLLASGALIDLVGFRSTITASALIGLASVALIAVRWHVELWPLQAPANAR